MPPAPTWPYLIHAMQVFWMEKDKGCVGERMGKGRVAIAPIPRGELERFHIHSPSPGRCTDLPFGKKVKEV